MAISTEQKTLKERIRSLLAMRRMTASDLGETENEKKIYQRQILHDSLVTYDTICKLLYMFRDVDANWLILGEGQMKKSTDIPQIFNHNEVNGSRAGGSINVGTYTLPVSVQALLDEKDARIVELEANNKTLRTVVDAMAVGSRK